jgi:hypothetical protein
MQDGGELSQFPSDMQVCVADPVKTNPIEQLYLAVFIYVKPDNVTEPFAGDTRSLQFTGSQVGAFPDHIPSVWHVLGTLPVRIKPVLQLYTTSLLSMVSFV